MKRKLFAMLLALVLLLSLLGCAMAEAEMITVTDTIVFLIERLRTIAK